MVNSSYAEPFEEFGVPKSTICRSLNVLLPPLKITSMKHLWDLIEIENTKKEKVRELITLTTIKNVR